MSYAPAAPQLRPLSVGEILDAAFKLYSRYFKPLVVCVLIVTVPLAILDTLITASTTDNAFDYGADTTTDDQAAFTAGQAMSAVVNVILFSVATAACFRALTAGYLGRATTWQESLGFGLRRLWPVLGATVLMVLALIPAFIALVIPGIWLAVAFSVAIPALLVERLGPATCLGRSFRLVRNRWWPTFGALIVMFVLIFIIQLVVGAIVGVVLTDSDNEALGGTLFTLANIVAATLTFPLQAAIVTVIYFDLRVRKEGFDLQLLAERMEAGPEAMAPPAADPEGFAPPRPASGPSEGFLPPRAPGAPERPGDEDEPRGPDQGGTASS